MLKPVLLPWRQVRLLMLDLEYQEPDADYLAKVGTT